VNYQAKYATTLTVLGVGLIGFGCFLFVAIHRSNEFDEKCHQRGGVPFHSRESNAICLNLRAIVEMPR